MQLNDYFLHNIHTIFGEAGDQWLASLPQQISQLAEQWQFEFISPVPNLSYGFVAKVKQKSTDNVAILKMTPPSVNLRAEMNWLQAVTLASPKVFCMNAEGTAALMEYIKPGVPLSHTVGSLSDVIATIIIAQTIKKIQKQQNPTTYAFKPLHTLSKDFDLLNKVYDKKLLAKASKYFAELNNETVKPVLLHGDLHHDNILSGQHGWRVIDPHGYIGHPAAEVGALFRNPQNHFPTDLPLEIILRKRVDVLAAELPFPRDVIIAWGFCVTVISLSWTYQDHKLIPPFDAEVAACLANMLP